MDKQQPIILLIIDGYGLTSSWSGNAIAMGNPVTIRRLWDNYSHFALNTFIKSNYAPKIIIDSSSSHSSIGAGRMMPTNFEQISHAISRKTFYQNKALVAAVKYANDYNSSLHIIGLASDAGVHGHIDHLKALILLAKSYQLPKVYLHLILDGVDTPATSAVDYIAQLESFINSQQVGQIATIMGRDFAMDRDCNWNNIMLAIRSLVSNRGRKAKSASTAIKHYYQKGLIDKNIPPTIITGENIEASRASRLNENDAVIMTNYRADSARELTIGLLGFHHFRGLSVAKNLHFVTFSSYFLPQVVERKISVAFPFQYTGLTLGKIIADNGLSQLRIAESEKQLQITTFFNCGCNELLPGEERIIIESAPISSCQKHPEMKAREITNCLLKAIQRQNFNFILANYANLDVLAHSGNIEATAKAVQFVDNQISQIYQLAHKIGATLIITSDHGNAEQMIQTTATKDREYYHSLNPVPFILVSDKLAEKYKSQKEDNLLTKLIKTKHTLADIAPTILELLHLEAPESMSGESLLKYLQEL